MKFGPIELIINKNCVPTDNLYIALIGRIEAEFASHDTYINNGEYASHYTAVVKNEDLNYNDVFEDKEYEFRNEEQDSTILKMYSFSKKNPTIKLKELDEMLLDLNEKLENNKVKKGDKRRYFRTRK